MLGTCGVARLSRSQALEFYSLIYREEKKAAGMNLPEPYMKMARRLEATHIGRRYALWESMVQELGELDRETLLQALEGEDDDDPPPASSPSFTPSAAPPPRPVEPVEPVEPSRLRIDAASQALEDDQDDGWPRPLTEAALQGMAGEVVRLIEPTTEADPAAILLQFLVGFGSLIGRGAFVKVDGHEHHANLFAVIVGDTSRARKGTAWRRVRDLHGFCDALWSKERVLGGLSSGEGLIWAVRDPIYGIDKKTGEDALTDRGVSDKRLLVVESEFGGSLRILGREGSTLSAILRQAYDGDDLRFMTKNNPAASTAPHVSLCGHVTREELEKHLSSVEAFNGLGNRILWTCARRSKALPFGGGGDPKMLEAMGTFLAGLADDAGTVGPLVWAPSGAKLWESAYDDLTTSQPGLLGALTSRAEAHSLRLAMIYALLDHSREIAEDHVLSALSVWRYCADSAAFLFGRSTATDSKTNAILDALQRAPYGMLRSEIYRDVFRCNTSADTVARLLAALVDSNAVRLETSTVNGRSVQRYYAVESRRT